MKQENPLTLADFADILAGDNELLDATARRLATFFRHDAHFAPQREQLTDLARDAGLAPEVGSYRAAVHLHGKLDRLLAARGWQDPAEVFDRDAEGLALAQLLHLIETRAAQPGAPAEELAKVRRRLASTRETEQLALQHLGEAAAAAPWVVEEWMREQAQARREARQPRATADWIEDFLGPVAGTPPNETPSLAEGGSEDRT